MFKKGTKNFNFPQWDFNEHPDFLDDINPAFDTIDQVLGSVKNSAEESDEKLGTIVPVVEDLTTRVKISEHDITDLQTKTANLEHDVEDTVDSVALIEDFDDNVRLILTGFTAEDTVKEAIDSLSNAVYERLYAMSKFIYDDVDRNTGMTFEDENGTKAIHRICHKFTSTLKALDVGTVLVAVNNTNAMMVNQRVILTARDIDKQLEVELTLGEHAMELRNKTELPDDDVLCDVFVMLEYVEYERRVPV